MCSTLFHDFGTCSKGLTKLYGKRRCSAVGVPVSAYTLRDHPNSLNSTRHCNIATILRVITGFICEPIPKSVLLFFSSAEIFLCPACASASAHFLIKARFLSLKFLSPTVHDIHIFVAPEL